MIQISTQFEAQSNPNSVRYYLVQHMPDVMRREVRNVGVIVERNSQRAARFIGQRTAEDPIDGRMIKNMADAQVYKMWVRHWRKSLLQENWSSQLLSSNTKLFNLLTGGEVTDAGADSVEEVCDYLYSMLVSHGGLQEAMDVVQENAANAIRADVKSEFRQVGILPSSGNSWCRHPVYENQAIPSDDTSHVVSFHQSTSKEEWIMEPLNLTTNQRWQSRQRAGYLAYLFGDLIRSARKRNKRCSNIAIVRVRNVDRSDGDVEYALNAVRKVAEVVDWENDNSRRMFISQREATARAVA